MDAWLIAVGIGIVVLILIYSLTFGVLAAIMKRVRLAGNYVRANPWATSAIVSPMILFLSLLAISLFSSGSLQLWGFQLPALSSLLRLSGIGLVTAWIIIFVSEHLSPTPKTMTPPSDRGGRVFFFVIIVLLASISEELLFRGFLQNILDNTLFLALDFFGVQVTSGAVVSAFAFGLIHIAPAKQMGSSIPVLTVSAIILGFLAGLSLTLSGSLILPIIIHIEFNLVGFVYVILRKSDSETASS